jgi:hypothetical protein
MRRLFTTVVALGVGVGAMSAPSAWAATATHNCGHLIVDPRGDAYQWFLPTKPYSPEADLLWVDAVTTASKLTFTVRVASMNPKPTTGAEVSIYFSVDHQGGTTNWLVSVSHEVDGDSYVLQNDDTQQVTAITGNTNARAGTYVIEVPRADIDAKFRGAMLNALGVITSQNVGGVVANAGFIEQSTGPEYKYRVGYPYGCRRK